MKNRRKSGRAAYQFLQLQSFRQALGGLKVQGEKGSVPGEIGAGDSRGAKRSTPGNALEKRVQFPS